MSEVLNWKQNKEKKISRENFVADSERYELTRYWTIDYHDINAVILRKMELLIGIFKGEDRYEKAKKVAELIEEG